MRKEDIIGDREMADLKYFVVSLHRPNRCVCMRVCACGTYGRINRGLFTQKLLEVILFVFAQTGPYSSRACMHCDSGLL